jgi:CBS-domain-containing membrane protein
MLVKDIMLSGYPTLFEDELATKARAVIREKGIRVLPVIDEKRRLLGTVSRNDVMTITSSVSPIRVKGIMSQPNCIATVDTEALKAVREMLQRDCWYAPVVDSALGNVYVGMLGLENFIDVVIKKESPRLMKTVYEVMSTNVVTCSPEDEIDNIWRLIQQKSLRGLPVVEKNKVLGIITEKDLLESGAYFPTFESKKGRFKSPAKISSVMKTPVASLKKTATVKDAAKIMLKRNLGRLPVVDEKGTLIGIIDREDIVKVLL